MPETLRGLKQALCTPGSRDPTETEPELCLSFSCDGLGQQWPATLIVNKRVQNAVLGCHLKNERMISVCFQSKPSNITVIQVYAQGSNAEEAKIEWYHEDLQELLKLTPKKDVLFMIGDWNAKVESQGMLGVAGKFGLGVQNKAGQRLTEMCQENTLVIANTLFQQHKKKLYTWTSLYGQYQSLIDYILCSRRWTTQSAKTRLGADCGSDH